MGARRLGVPKGFSSDYMRAKTTWMIPSLKMSGLLAPLVCKEILTARDPVPLAAPAAIVGGRDPRKME